MKTFSSPDYPVVNTSINTAGAALPLPSTWECNDEADHYIFNLRRFGIVCYKNIGCPQLHFAFAWQICANSLLFSRFDSEDKDFLKAISEEEHKDEWYHSAGEKLSTVGFKHFVEMNVAYCG